MAALARVFAAVSLALVPLVILGSCSGAAGDRASESVHRTIGAGAAATVRVDNVAGTVRVEGWRKPIVDVQATKYGADSDELRSITIEAIRDEGGITVATRYARATRGGGVRYLIFVPADASLRIVNVAGGVEIAGVRGNVDVETQAGEISADLGRVAGGRSVDLRATTGAITLVIAPQSSATVEAQSTVGAFSSDIPGISQQREHLVGARGAGTIGLGSARIQLATTTGAISLRER